jgi:hypothetical protein
METGRLGVGAGVHDVDTVAAKRWQHQLIAILAGVAVAATANIPSRVVKFIAYSGHLQAVDHLQHTVTLNCLREADSLSAGQEIFRLVWNP